MDGRRHLVYFRRMGQNNTFLGYSVQTVHPSEKVSGTNIDKLGRGYHVTPTRKRSVNN